MKETDREKYARVYMEAWLDLVKTASGGARKYEGTVTEWSNPIITMDYSNKKDDECTKKKNG